MTDKISVLKWLAIFLIIIFVAVNEFLISTVALAVGGKKTLGIIMEENMKKMFPPEKMDTNVINIVLAHGVPEVYGQKLNVSFDKVEQSMNAMKVYDQDLKYGNGQIKLSGDKMSRYIKIGKIIACEFCCGAKTMVNDDGSAACGCGHSQAMRGLMAYLIEKHGNEYSDDQILRELARWKGVYFPKGMVEKVTKEINSGNFSRDVNALLIGTDMEKLKKSIKDAPASPSNSNGSQPLPGQQGGC